MHEGVVFRNASQQRQELIRRGEPSGIPDHADLNDRVIHTQPVEMDGAVEIEIEALALRNALKEIEKLPRVFVGTVIEGDLVCSGAVLVTEGLLPQVSSFATSPNI